MEQIVELKKEVRNFKTPRRLRTKTAQRVQFFEDNEEYAYVLKFYESRTSDFLAFWKERLYQQKTIDMDQDTHRQYQIFKKQALLSISKYYQLTPLLLAFLPIYKRQSLQGYVNTKLMISESVNVIGDFWFNNTGATELVQKAYMHWRDS